MNRALRSHISYVVGLSLLLSSCATSSSSKQMIPAERISRDPVVSEYRDVPLPRGNWRAECFLLFDQAQTYRAVQLAGIGLTTLGLIGALLSDDNEVVETASQVATAVGTLTQLGAGTAASVKEHQANERGCVEDSAGR